MFFLAAWQNAVMFMLNFLAAEQKCQKILGRMPKCNKELLSAMRACGVVSTVLWGGAYVAMKFALECFHPMVMIFLLLVVSSATFLVLLPSMRAKQRYTMGDWRIFLVLIICEPCLYFAFEGYALNYTSASQAGMLSATLPIFVGGFGYFLLKEKIGFVAWLGCFTCHSRGGVAECGVCGR